VIAAELPPTLGFEEVRRILGVSKYRLYGDIKADRLTGGMRPLPIGKPYRWATAPLLAEVGLGQALIALPLDSDTRPDDGEQ
jgi:hypothetical protein